MACQMYTTEQKKTQSQKGTKYATNIRTGHADLLWLVLADLRLQEPNLPLNAREKPGLHDRHYHRLSIRHYRKDRWQPDQLCAWYVLLQSHRCFV